jgi:hypothetical protein
MSIPAWQISGDYFETCNCDYLCPCISSNLAAQPTKGHCDAAMVFHIDHGQYGAVKLDGLNFAVLIHAPDVMGQGNWAVGLITDDQATADQQQALMAIASGQAGGPPAALGPLLGQFLGAESKPIHFQKNGLSRSVSIPGILEQACEGVPSPVAADAPLYVDNTLHPANARLALAKATRSHLHAFGINWDDTSGNNNGHFAPFHWRAGGTV